MTDRTELDHTAGASPERRDEDVSERAEAGAGFKAMSPSRLFILRPIATSLLMMAIFLTGIVGFQFLPLSALPEVDYPTIQVQTFYPGASPEVMTSMVTAPLERQLGQMPGLQRMSAMSCNLVSGRVLEVRARDRMGASAGLTLA